MLVVYPRYKKCGSRTKPLVRAVKIVLDVELQLSIDIDYFPFVK